MSKRYLVRWALPMTTAMCCLFVAVSASTASAATSACSAPAVSQPFLAFGDNNFYTLAPGESSDQFSGSGWALTGGAHIASMPVMDGVQGSVLDIPGGGTAVSPAICVQSDYPTARALIATTPGASVGVSTSYPGLLPIVPRVQFSGAISSAAEYWQPSTPFQVHPGNLPGWQRVQFTFTNTTPGGNAVIYDFFIDPRMSG